jgi:signal transduction histidine kinase
LEALRLLDLLSQKQDPGYGTYDRLHAEHNLGVIYLQQHQLAKAAPLLLTAFSGAKASGLKDLVPHMEPDVAAFFAATGDYKKAYDHILHYALLRDTLLEQQKVKALSNWMQARMNEKDKAMLSQKLEIAQQQKKLQAKNFWIGVTALGSLLLLAGLLGFMRSYKNKQRLQQSAFTRLQQEQEINQLKAQVRGEEQERNRIAMELHDGIASQLWAIKLNVDSLQQQHPLHGAFLHNLHTIYQQLDDTAQEVRKTAHNLMPDLLLEEGLGTALASLCDKIKKQTELEVDFLEYGTIPRMDEEIELSLYRMIQELIQNVLKHAEGATQLLVQLSCIDTLLNITVEDNGAGFSETNLDSSKGIGLRHIQKRVKTLNGHIDLQSVPGKGTTVYLEFDIQHLL